MLSRTSKAQRGSDRRLSNYLIEALESRFLLAFVHPSLPTSLQELDTIKANLNQEPYKTGYALLANTSTAKLDWVEEGPYENVSRAGAYDANLAEWQNSMAAVYNLARMWYFTGNAAYAQKAHDILIAWANTNTSFSGNEAGLALGDAAVNFGGGADILRGTWPGWTAADTTTVQNYFSNVLWPASAGWPTQGPANKGALYLAAGMSIAVFCDNDTSKFDHVLNMFRTFHGTGLMDTLPTGQMGETGRDAGHAFGTLNAMAFIAECAWKQGVDLYSELDNRLLAAGEYYARNTFTTDDPYVPFGSIDWQWMNNAPGRYNANRSAFYLLQNAYKNRFGLPTPWIDRKLEEQNVEAYNFMYAKTADFTTATPAPASFPAVSLASSGLTLTTLGTQTAGRSVSYSNGVWTLTGLGNGVWSDTTDDAQFAYKQMSGDGAMVAKVNSFTNSGTQAGKAGLMIRDNLSPTISQRALVDVSWNSSGGNAIEAHMRGWTVNWGGGGYDDRSHDWPPGIAYWIKIERRDKQITTFASPDGASWSPLTCTYYGNLPSTLYMGLFLCSGNTTSVTASFSNVAFTGGTGGLVTTPAAPLGVLASGSNKAITVRWLGSFGATGYDLLRSTTSGSGYTVIASNLSTDKTSYVDTTAVPGTTYYYVVRAKNSAGTSGNSPEFGAALLSAPLVNLAFGGTTTASINIGSQVGGSDDAFNGDPGSKWFGYNAPTGWLQYDFGAGNAQVVKRYTVNSADVATRDPKNWNFLGSQDGVSWTTLDSQSDQSFVLRMQQNVYDIPNATAYRYYRIDITANNGATGVAIGDLGLWGNSGRTLRDDTYTLVNRNSHKVVDVTSAANGAPVVQQDFQGDDTQQWNLAWQGNGLYRATNVSSTKVLDNGGTSTAGANLVIQPPNGANSQLWTIVPDGDGFFCIVSANSGLVAGVSGGSTANGANVVQVAYSGSDSQQWMPGTAVASQPIPPVPTGLTATAVSISTINLSWTASPGAVGYEIKRATVSGGPYTTIASGGGATNYSDTYLTSNTTYYYVVSAVNGSGYSADPAQAQATTLTGAPLAPTGLTAKLGTDRVILNWTATAGATSYTVKRATASGGPYTTLAGGLASPTYTDTSRNSNVAYYYVVDAANAYGSSPDSAQLAIGAGTLGVYLKFNETGGTIAADSSGLAQSATVFGGSFVPGFLDNALQLPATSTEDYAKLPSGITSGLTDFTVATWINVDTFATWQRIFDFGTGTDNFMFLAAQGPAGAGRPRFSIRTPSVGEQTLDSSIAITAGAWTHLAVTRSGSTVRLYVNGTLAGTGTSTLSPSDLGITTRNYLGRSQFNDPYLDASLDDFRIYADALSSTEVNALARPAPGAPTQLAGIGDNGQVVLSWVSNATTAYTVKRSTTPGGPYTTTASGVTDLTYTDTGLTNDVAYYYVVSGSNAQGSGPDSAEIAITPTALRVRLKFDETSGTSAADATGHGFNGTLTNGPIWSGSGKVGRAIDLDGTDDYVALPNGVMNGLTTATIAGWINLDAFNTWARVFDFGTGTTNYMFLTTQYSTSGGSNQRLRFAIRTPSVGEQQINSSAALNVGSWAHFAVVLNGSVGTLYVNGVQVGQNAAMTLNPSSLGSSTQNYLGKSQFASDPYLNGRVDDFRIYSRALSAGEVSTLASTTAVAGTPSGLTATGGENQIALSWAAVAGAASYNIKRGTASGGPYATLATDVITNSYSDSSATPGTTYYYVVSAVNVIGEGGNSAPASATAYTTVFAGTTADDRYYVRRSGPDLQVWVGGAGDGSGPPTYSTPFASATTLEFDGNGGNDVLTVEGGDAFPPGGITFNGGAGDDALMLKNTTSGPLTAASGNESITVDGGSFAFANDLAGASLHATNGAVVSLNSTQHLTGLTIENAATVRVTSPNGGGGGTRVLIVGSLNIANGTIDLADNAMIVRSGTVASIKASIASGFAGGAWNGTTGITSTAAASDPGTAIGFGSNAVMNKSSFAGVTGVTSSDVLVRFTYAGDANLDGQVDIGDLGLLSGAWQQPSGKTWFDGDFTYDGAVDIGDLGLLSGNWQKGVGNPI